MSIYCFGWWWWHGWWWWWWWRYALLQKSTVDIWLELIDAQLQLSLYVTSGNVTLTSDPLLTTSGLVSTDADDSRCSFYVDIYLGRNLVALTSKSHFILVTNKCLKNKRKRNVSAFLYYRSETGAGQTLRVQSPGPGGGSFLREMTPRPPSWNYDVISEIRLRQPMRI